MYNIITKTVSELDWTISV